MKIYRGGFTYGRAPLGPHASCVHEVSRYGVHARRVRSQAHTANGSASYFHRRHKGHQENLSDGEGPDGDRLQAAFHLGIAQVAKLKLTGGILRHLPADDDRTSSLLGERFQAKCYIDVVSDDREGLMLPPADISEDRFSYVYAYADAKLLT